MSDALWLGVLATITSALTVAMPLLMKRADNRQKNAERKAAEDRQDAIAERLAAKVSETADHAKTAREAISNKLDAVKTLVNGNVTDLLRDKLDSLVREIALLEQNRELKIALGQDVGPTETVSLELARARMRELRIQLDFKITADRAADRSLA